MKTQQNTHSAGINRREFLQLSAATGGGLYLGVAWPAAATAKAGEAGFSPFAFAHIAADNTATVTVAKSEMGQGVRTTLAMIVAEELDLDWPTVVVRQAENNADKYGRQGTGGSGSVRDAWGPLREGAARARTALLKAAAQHWSVETDQLHTHSGRVINPANGEALTYGALAAAAARVENTDDFKLKAVQDFKLIGHELPGVDVSDIVTGQATYGLDVRQPGQLFASLLRCPEYGGSLASVDHSEAMKVPGVSKVFSIKAVGPPVNTHDAVVVVASNSWAAMRGRDALKVEWKKGAHAQESSAQNSQNMHQALQKSAAELVNKVGDPDAVLARAKKVIRGDYEAPFIAHATMEPMNCTARLDGEAMRIWAPTQFPNWAAGSVAAATGLKAENIALEVTLLGGGFGRRINPDFVTEAGLVAQQCPGQAVQVMWSREDDMRHDFYRPQAVHRFEASLGSDGYPEAIRQRFSTPAINLTIGNPNDPGVSEADGTGNMLYKVPNRSCEYALLDSGVHRGWWRAVHTTHGTFALESFIDELAEAAGIDALTYRLKMIDELQVERPGAHHPDHPFRAERLKAVLTLAAEQAGWGQPLPDGRALGIACAIDHSSYCAEVVEVSLENGKPRVHKVTCAVDCGPVLNPNGARAQLEGGVHQALSVALGERITVRNGRVEQGNFDDYPLLRIHQAPVAIATHFVASDYAPTGLGEPSVPPLAPALANAVYRLTKKRLRSLPLNIG